MDINYWNNTNGVPPNTTLNNNNTITNPEFIVNSNDYFEATRIDKSKLDDLTDLLDSDVLSSLLNSSEDSSDSSDKEMQNSSTPNSPVRKNSSSTSRQMADGRSADVPEVINILNNIKEDLDRTFQADNAYSPTSGYQSTSPLHSYYQPHSARYPSDPVSDYDYPKTSPPPEYNQFTKGYYSTHGSTNGSPVSAYPPPPPSTNYYYDQSPGPVTIHYPTTNYENTIHSTTNHTSSDHEYNTLMETIFDAPFEHTASSSLTTVGHVSNATTISNGAGKKTSGRKFTSSLIERNPGASVITKASRLVKAEPVPEESVPSMTQHSNNNRKRKSSEPKKCERDRKERRKETNRRASAKYRERQDARKQKQESKKLEMEKEYNELEKANCVLKANVALLSKQLIKAIRSTKNK